MNLVIAKPKKQTKMNTVISKKKSKKTIKIIDLFAGIGGFHWAFHNLGANCVFSSEINDYARKTYAHNFQKVSPELFLNGNFAGDITKVDEKKIPNFDVLCGGFPCQPFSQAGVRKGFDDTRGTLFFDIVRILKEKKPQAYFLENVRGLLNHDEGKTYKKIEETLQDLGYSFFPKIVKACDYGLPQLRPRLFMVGFLNPTIDFKYPEATGLKKTMSDVFNGKCTREVGFTLRVGGRGSGIADRRNWDSYYVNGEVKRLTSKEGKRMQGFPESFEFPVSEAQAMKQLGNSVAIDAIQAVANEMMKHLQ